MVNVPEDSEFPGKLADPRHIWEMEREENGFTEEQQQEYHDLKNVKIPKLKHVITAHASAHWSPQADEKLWAHLPGDPPKFPWISLPGSREFHEGCVAHEHAGLRAAPCANGKPHAQRGEFALPDIPLPPEDPFGQPPRVRFPILRQHHAYLLEIIRWHASHAGQDLCWENNAILGLLVARLERRTMSVEKPPVDACLQECMRYRGAIERAIQTRPAGTPLMVQCPERSKIERLVTLSGEPAYCHAHASDVVQHAHNDGCRLHGCARALEGAERHDGVPVVQGARSPVEYLALGTQKLGQLVGISRQNAVSGAENHTPDPSESPK